MAFKTKKFRNWFSSTLFVLLLVFLISVFYGINRYGLDQVIDASIFYIIGATFTALVIIIVGSLIAKSKKIKLW